MQNSAPGKLKILLRPDYYGRSGKSCRRILADPTTYPTSKIEAKLHADVVGNVD